MDTLPKRLAHLIALSGLDYATIDTRAGLTDGHTGQIVRGGRAHPAASTVIAIARVLGTTAEYLVDGEGRVPSRRRVRKASKAAGHGTNVRRRTPSRKGDRPHSGASTHERAPSGAAR